MNARIELPPAREVCPTTTRRLLAEGARLVDVRELAEVAVLLRQPGIRKGHLQDRLLLKKTPLMFVRPLCWQAPPRWRWPSAWASHSFGTLVRQCRLPRRRSFAVLLALAGGWWVVQGLEYAA